MHRRLSRLAALAVVAAALISGCNKEDPIEPRIVSLERVSGMDQAGFVGGLLTDPLVVRAHDQDGQPISGIQVAWTATGGGVATPAAGVTDADGLTSTSYRLGDAVGTQTITAIINGVDQGVTFTATATPAPASMITVGGCFAKLSLRASPPNTLISSSCTILMTCCAGFSACETEAPRARSFNR